MSSSSLPSHYPLSRSHYSTTRLIAQHALWQHDLRFLIHPTIATALALSTSSPLAPSIPSTGTAKRNTAHNGLPSPTPLHIADLATGTVLWPLSLLQQYPQAQVTASDISLAQCPPKPFLPNSLKIQEWDMYTPVPSAWLDRFDLVHIRLALLAIRSNDAHTVLSHALGMLKPGAWMQWEELDPEGASLTVAEGADVTAEELKRFQQMQERSDFAGLKWVGRLEKTFEEVGFEEVGREVVKGDMGTGWLLQGLQFGVMEEEGGKEAVGGDVEWGMGIWMRGVARVVPKVVVWGRKPGRKEK